MDPFLRIFVPLAFSLPQLRLYAIFRFKIVSMPHAIAARPQSRRLYPVLADIHGSAFAKPNARQRT